MRFFSCCELDKHVPGDTRIPAKFDDERYWRPSVPRASFFMRRMLRRPTMNPALYGDAELTTGQCDVLASCVRSAQRDFPDRGLLFLYGIMPRSGTNFLYRLLLRNPAFSAPQIAFAELPVLAGEAYFAEPMELFGRIHQPSADAFGRMEWMAYALAGFRNRLLDLAPADSLTLVKNPLLYGVDLSPIFFPDDRILMIERDARYICDSFRRSFARRRLSRTFEDICLETSLAMEKALRLRESMDDALLLAVKYEDLMADKAVIVGRIADWLGRPDIRLASSDAGDVPIYGSSVYSPRAADGAVDWAPVKPPEGFNPAARPLDWNAAELRTFERVCGPVNRRMGYA